MEEMARLLTTRKIGVTRFEFAYMAARRIDGKRRPPPKAERLLDEMTATVAAFEATGLAQGLPLLVGGKSMGGRVATMVADRLYSERRIAGGVALGYPFHPPGKPENLRTAHLQTFQTPLLIVQGERDPFGNLSEIVSYNLPATIEVVWARDGDHDLGPRGGSGTTRKANLSAAADAIAAFASRLG